MATPLSITYVPGYVWTVGETITEAKLNLAANPTISLLGTITTSTIGDGAITTPKLADEAVTTAKLADEAVTTAKLADGEVTPVKLSEASRYDTGQYAAGVYAAGVYPAGVYAITLSPVPIGYAAGMVVRFKADTANTGAVDINVNSLGAKNLFKNVDDELTAGNIPINAVVTCIYDGTNFQMLAVAGVESVDRGGSSSGHTPLQAGIIATVAHGLTVAPRFVRWVLVCTAVAGDRGWAQYDEMDVSALVTELVGGEYVPAFYSGADATNLWLIGNSELGTSGSMSVLFPTKTTGVMDGPMTRANWAAKVYYSI
jgi:hypothetical protein